MRCERFAHGGLIARGIDGANAIGLRLCAGEVGAAHLLEEGPGLALETIEVLAGGAEALAGNLVRTVEKQRAVGLEPQVYYGAQAIDELHGNALPGALVGGS